MACLLGSPPEPLSGTYWTEKSRTIAEWFHSILHQAIRKDLTIHALSNIAKRTRRGCAVYYWTWHFDLQWMVIQAWVGVGELTWMFLSHSYHHYLISFILRGSLSSWEGCIKIVTHKGWWINVSWWLGQGGKLQATCSCQETRLNAMITFNCLPLDGAQKVLGILTIQEW